MTITVDNAPPLAPPQVIATQALQPFVVSAESPTEIRKHKLSHKHRHRPRVPGSAQQVDEEFTPQLIPHSNKEGVDIRPRKRQKKEHYQQSLPENTVAMPNMGFTVNVEAVEDIPLQIPSLSSPSPPSLSLPLPSCSSVDLEEIPWKIRQITEEEEIIRREITRVEKLCALSKAKTSAIQVLSDPCSFACITKHEDSTERTSRSLADPSGTLIGALIFDIVGERQS